MSFTRRSLQVVAFVCTLIVGTAAMAVVVTQTTWFKEWLRGFIVRQAGDYVNGRLSIGRLGGNLFSGVELEDVEIAMNGEPVVRIADVGVDYNVLSFLGGDLVLDDIRINRPVVRLERTPEGLNLANMIKVRTPDPDEPRARRTIAIGEIGVSDGTLYVGEHVAGTSAVEVPARIERLDASVGVTSDAEALTVEIGHVSLRASEPALHLTALSGLIRRTPDAVHLENVSLRTAESSLQVQGSIDGIESGPMRVDATVTSDRLTLPEIAAILPALRGYEMQPAFEIRAEGPLDRLGVDVNVREARLGRAAGALTVDAAAPGRAVAGDLTTRNLNLAPIARAAAFRSDISGRVRFDLALPSEGFPLSGTYAVDAGTVEVAGYEVQNLAAGGRIDGRTIQIDAAADAYGGRATTEGTVVTGDALALDLRGRAGGVDLRNLPAALNAPRVASRIDAEYTLTGRGRVFSGTLHFQPSVLAGATIAAGTMATFRVGDGAPAYAARGRVADLDLQQIGRGFGISALAADRYASRLNAAFDIEGAGGGRYPLALEATGTVTDSTLFGASFPHVQFTAALAGDDLEVDANGRFAGLDPAAVSGNSRLAGDLSGSVDVTASLRDYAGGLAPEAIDAAGRVELEQSALAGLTIGAATIDGRYANGEGRFDRITIEGPDVTAAAAGVLALNDTGASRLTLHVETSALDRIGALVGRPLKGSAVVDATVTGNASELRADGMLAGSNIGYGEHEALELDGRFTVAVPELTPSKAAVQADVNAAFLEVAGQRVNELALEAAYAGSRLEFDASASDGMRELAAAGEAIFHPDHEEVHLTEFALAAEGAEWRTAPGSDTAVRYGGNRVEIEGLQLVSGDQRVTADGVFGGPGEPLRVRVENVDVASLDRLLLGDERVAGRLFADATISGTTEAPRVAGEFSLTQGAFRTFTFDALAGTVDYAGAGVTVDVRLDQAPGAWLTATGYAPLTLFRPTPPGAAGSGAPPPGEAVDLQIATSTIDLGLVQGFTAAVSDVTGVLQANVHVTGSGYDPRFDGTVEIRGGTFAVPDLGTRYTGLDTRIDLVTDRLAIEEFRILDDRGSAMTIGGSLGLRERAVGDVNIGITSDDFEVIDNDLAELTLDTNLRVTGAVRSPRVEGSIEIASGTVDIARVVERTTSDAYQTTAADLSAAGADAAARETAAREAAAGSSGEAAPAPGAGVFDAVTLDIGLTVPGNLVLNGENIRPANAPIGVGDANVTVGGTLQIRKAPGGPPVIAGEVTTVRGSYTFQGRRFDIERDGTIRFAGTDVIDPALDIRARRVISAVETFVHVQGTMRQPEIALSSNPPLDEADILSLIVFNQPINQLGEGQQVSLIERAGALAGGYVASGLARSIGNALELDEFEIQAQGEGGGPSLSIGEQVGERLFFRVRQGFGDAQATEFILEYQVADFLRLAATAAETSSANQRVTFRRVERGGIDLLFFFSY